MENIICPCPKNIVRSKIDSSKEAILSMDLKDGRILANQSVVIRQLSSNSKEA